MDQPREPSQAPAAASTGPNRATPRTDNDDKRGGASRNHGPLYWLAVNLTKMLRDYIRNHKIGFILLSVGVVVTLFLTRALWQPYLIGLRRSLGLITIGVLLLCVAYLGMQLKSRKWKVIVPLLFILSLFGYAYAAYLGYDFYEYAQLWYRFKTLPIERIDRLPETDHERIQPQNAIYNLSKTKVADSESLARPDFVKINGEYRWTIAIEPKYWQNRLMGNVREIFNVPATESSPSFSKENRVTVDFDTGEFLYLGKNVFTNTVKTFGFWRFLNYQPLDARHIVDGKGQWVQAVTLIRWKGLFFPRPEFGGVHIVPQVKKKGKVTNFLNRLFFGKGTWIPQDEIKAHSYLVGQNLVPQMVSRFNAQSLRFKNGFLAPFPGRHRGDIRIPDLQSDVNDQPFTTFFKFADAAKSKLYHYFSLEPYHPGRHGLNTSLLVPADGLGNCYVYYHADKDEALTGVSAVATKVMDTKKNYGWGNIMPVEYRPWIKIINGKHRFFWLTTVVTKTHNQTKVSAKEKNNDPRQTSTADDAADQDFLTGSVPEIALMEAERDIVVWVDPLKPDGWISQVTKAFDDLWK